MARPSRANKEQGSSRRPTSKSPPPGSSRMTPSTSRRDSSQNQRGLSERNSNSNHHDNSKRKSPPGDDQRNHHNTDKGNSSDEDENSVFNRGSDHEGDSPSLHELRNEGDGRPVAAVRGHDYSEHRPPSTCQPRLHEVRDAARRTVELSTCQKAALASFASKDMFKVLKFVDDAHLRKYPDIMEEAFKRLGITDDMEKLSLLPAAEKKFKDSLNGQCNYVIKKLRKKYIGKFSAGPHLVFMFTTLMKLSSIDASHS